MNEKYYTITLADGTRLENLRLNGNNFISPGPLNASVFEQNLSDVMIFDGETEEHHTNMELVHCITFHGEIWFILRDLTPDELWRMQMEANVEYIAMMGDVDL